MARYRCGFFTFLATWLFVSLAHAQEPTPRPVVSLAEAHAIATDSLTEEGRKQFYCVNAFPGETLDKERKRILVWHIQMMNDAGLGISATIPRQFAGLPVVRASAVPPQLHPGIKSMTDLESAIANFRKLPKGAEIRQGEGVVVQYNTRKFYVHPQEASGEYAHNAREVIGPAGDGFVMRVCEVKRGETGGKRIPGQPPYWKTSRRFFPGFTPQSELVVDIDYAQGWSALEMYRAIGPNSSLDPALVRPSLLLPEVCERATASLREDERRDYVVMSARTRSLMAHDVIGEWHVALRNERGDQILLELDRDGKVVRATRQTMPSKTKAKIGSVADAEKMLPALLNELEVKGTVTREGNKLTLEIHPRTFHMHRELEPGIFAEETQTVRGPGRNGFIVIIEEADFAGDLKTRIEAPKNGLPGTLESNFRGYFSRRKFACKATDPQRILIVEKLSGQGQAAVANAVYERLEPWTPAPAKP